MQISRPYSGPFFTRLFVFFLLGPAVSVVLHGAEPLKTATVPVLDGGVQINGQLDEPQWKKAYLLGPFVNNDDASPVTELTRVRVFHDREALYLGWEVSDSDIQATFTARDSHFWEEEVVEFFLSTERIDTYFELQWNPLGGIFDAIIRNKLGTDGKSKGIDGDWSYTAEGMKSRVRVDGTVGNAADQDQGWTVEVRVPFADLGISRPEPGTTWRANFYRFNRGGKRAVEKQSWTPTLDPMFHQPNRFGFLKFQ